MHYTKHTVTQKVKFPVKFICEKCGEETFFVHQMNISRSFTDRNIFTENQYNKKEEKVYAKVKAESERCMQKIIREGKEKKYRTAKYLYRCQKCFSKPMWARMNYKLFDSISEVLLYVGIFLLLLCLIALATDSWVDFALMGMPKYTCICIGLFALIKAIVLTHRCIIESKIKKMDEKYLPRLIKEER